MRFQLSARALVLMTILWLGSLVTVAVVAAQARQWQPMVPLREPLILSGADIGFRVEGTINDVPAGRLVIRGRNGQWVEPRTPQGTGVVPADQK